MNILRTVKGKIKGTADTKFFMGEHLTLNLNHRETLRLMKFLADRIQPIPEGDLTEVFVDSKNGSITIHVGIE